MIAALILNQSDEGIHVRVFLEILTRGLGKATVSLNCGLSLKLTSPLKQRFRLFKQFHLFEDKYTTSLLSRPTFKQALPHFLRLIPKPGAVGEIEREAGFRQRVLRLLVVHHESGGAVHGAQNLQGEEEMHFC